MAGVGGGCRWEFRLQLCQNLVVEASMLVAEAVGVGCGEGCSKRLNLNSLDLGVKTVVEVCWQMLRTGYRGDCKWKFRLQLSG